MSDETLNIDEACKYLVVSHSVMDDLVASGTIPAAKIGKCWVFRKCDLSEYLSEQVRIQTEERRRVFNEGGAVAKIKPASAAVRQKRKLPDLAALQRRYPLA